MCFLSEMETLSPINDKVTLWYFRRDFGKSSSTMDTHFSGYPMLLIVLQEVCLGTALSLSNHTESDSYTANVPKNRNKMDIPAKIQNLNYIFKNSSMSERENKTTAITNQTEFTNHFIVRKNVVSDSTTHKLPKALIIASPVAAITIIIFLCVAYYCHASQLDERAKHLAIQIAASDYTSRNVNDGKAKPSICYANAKTDVLPPKRKSLRPIPPGPKRGSMGHDGLTRSVPRRQSAFIL